MDGVAVRLDVYANPLELRRALETYGSDLQDAFSAAVVRQTEETKGAHRVQIAARLGSRAANALRGRVYPSTKSGGQEYQGLAAGFIYSAWKRRAAGGGPRIDLLAAFEDGASIRPVRGGALAVPLPAAYAVSGIPRGRRPTPDAVETALDQDLFIVARPGRPALLCAKDVAISGGRRRRISAARVRRKSGALGRRRTANAIVPLFVLLKNSRLPKRLDFASVRERAAEGLSEKAIVEMARRGL